VIKDRLNRLEAHSGPNSEKEEARRKIRRALAWQEELHWQGRRYQDVVPTNDEERESLAILKGFEQWVKELWPERYQ
jgi:hypothetical protein